MIGTFHRTVQLTNPQTCCYLQQPPSDCCVCWLFKLTPPGREGAGPPPSFLGNFLATSMIYLSFKNLYKQKPSTCS